MPVKTMKTIAVCIAAMLISQHLFSQSDSITFSVDTINIRGVVYYDSGAPVKGIKIGMLSVLPGYPWEVKTDESGKFELKGVYPHEKLRLFDERYSRNIFPIQGSRYMVLYLPPPSMNLLGADTIQVKANRRYPEPKISFKVANEKVFIEQEPVYPVYPGGPGKLINILKENLVYPDKAIANNIEGTVEIRFTVEHDGSLNDFVIIKGIGYGCDEEVIALLKKTKNWKPGIYMGRRVINYATVKVAFKLTDK